MGGPNELKKPEHRKKIETEDLSFYTKYIQNDIAEALIIYTKIDDIRENTELFDKLSKSISDSYLLSKNILDKKDKVVQQMAVAKVNHSFINEIKKFLLDNKIVKPGVLVSFDRGPTEKWFYDNKISKIKVDDLRNNDVTIALTEGEKRILLDLFLDRNSKK